MQLRVLSRDPLDDGWNEPVLPPRRSRQTAAFMLEAGDTVLHRADGKLTPAVLVEPAGTGCWLARDARSTPGLIYLGTENIITRLPRTDLLGEAA